MKKSIIVLLAALVTINIWAVDVAYYNSLNGKSGSTLREAVTALTYSKHTTAMGYNWTFDNIDIVNGVVLDMYSTCDWTVTSDQCGNYSGICDCYNREHTVPQSLFNKQSPQVGDRHHLFLTDGKVNGVRSDYAFGETNSTTGFNGISNSSKALGKFGTSSYAYSSKTVYEPDDQYKGDIARAVLYMVVRYATADVCRAGSASNAYPVTTWSSNPMFSGSLSTNYGLSDAAKQTFLKWHRADPVSKKEIDRNNGVEAKQGNRNPFVDYPCLVEYLWGNHAGESFALANMLPSFAPGWDESDGCSGSAPICTKLATPNVTVIAGDRQVSLSWTAIDGAASYSVTISEGKGFTTECLDEPIIGKVTTSGGICTCVISGLVNNLTYTTSVKAIASDSSCDSDSDQDQVTPSAEGPQTAIEQAPTQQNVQSDETARKIMYHGMIYILRGEHIYDVTGRLVK